MLGPQQPKAKQCQVPLHLQRRAPKAECLRPSDCGLWLLEFCAWPPALIIISTSSLGARLKFKSSASAFGFWLWVFGPLGLGVLSFCSAAAAWLLAVGLWSLALCWPWGVACGGLVGLVAHGLSNIGPFGLLLSRLFRPFCLSAFGSHGRGVRAPAHV